MKIIIFIFIDPLSHKTSTQLNESLLQIVKSNIVSLLTTLGLLPISIFRLIE